MSRVGELGVFDASDAGSAAAVDGKILTPTASADPSDQQLRTRITAPSGLTLELLTVKCAGECADVVAEANGGNPPYHVSWDDGSTAAMRHVCPLESGELKVQVTDTEISDTEFGYTAQVATATVTAKVLECTTGDAGAQVDSGADAATSVENSWCTPHSIAPAAADGCERLTPMQNCGPNNWDVTYALPFALVPGHRSCLVAFGGFIPAVPDPGISVWYSNKDCEPEGELSSGTLPNPGDSEGREVCLLDPPSSYTRLYVNTSGSGFIVSTPPDWSMIDLRLCKECPGQ